MDQPELPDGSELAERRKVLEEPNEDEQSGPLPSALPQALEPAEAGAEQAPEPAKASVDDGSLEVQA